MELEKLEEAKYLQEEIEEQEAKIKRLNGHQQSLRDNNWATVAVHTGGRTDEARLSNQVGIQAFNLALAEEKELLENLQNSLKAL